VSPAFELAPGIWITEVATPDYDVRGALILGTRRAAVWDTLSHPRDMSAYLPLIGGRDLVIVYSHADWDHIWGTAGLPHDSAVVVAHELTGERFGDDVPLTLAEKRATAPGAWDAVRLIPPTRLFARDLSIDLGGLSLSLRHLPGHTPDSIVGLVPERGVLLAGDAVETPCPVVPRDCPLDAWLEELRRWERDDRVRTVVPAHGAVGGRDVIAQTGAYLEALRRGSPVHPLEPLTPFYREAHANNIAHTRPVTSG
jgi:glyoxylase-like metal-dependent hydrolase (beta-lactamase superfamily II)